MTGLTQLPSGIYVPEDIAAECRRPICVDLFCGAGGFSLGMLQAGFEVIAAMDNDPACFITYTYNLGAYPLNIVFASPEDNAKLEKYLEKHAVIKRENGIFDLVTSGGNKQKPEEYTPVRNYFYGDIHKFTGKQILNELGMEQGEIDCLVGGPPCQGFSHAGNRNVMDPRNSLVFEFARMVCELKPKTMVMENVPGILSMVTPEGIPVMDAMCRILEDGGFGGYDALRKSLIGQPSRRAAIRGKQSRENAEAEEQMEFNMAKGMDS